MQYGIYEGDQCEDRECQKRLIPEAREGERCQERRCGASQQRPMILFHFFNWESQCSFACQCKYRAPCPPTEHVHGLCCIEGVEKKPWEWQKRRDGHPRKQREWDKHVAQNVEGSGGQPR